ncbi:unnamed protein product, partial [Prorocentrum cordatum]
DGSAAAVRPLGGADRGRGVPQAGGGHWPQEQVLEQVRVPARERPRVVQERVGPDLGGEEAEGGPARDADVGEGVAEAAAREQHDGPPVDGGHGRKGRPAGPDEVGRQGGQAPEGGERGGPRVDVRPGGGGQQVGQPLGRVQGRGARVFRGGAARVDEGERPQGRVRGRGREAGRDPGAAGRAGGPEGEGGRPGAGQGRHQAGGEAPDAGAPRALGRPAAGRAEGPEPVLGPEGSDCGHLRGLRGGAEPGEEEGRRAAEARGQLLRAL